MKWKKKSLFELAAVLVVAAVVATLAVLQYRWASQIGTAEQGRLREDVSSGVASFTGQFAYDIERLSEAFPNEPDAPESALESRIEQQYAAWMKTSAHPRIVSGVYIWKTAYAPKSYYESLDLLRRRFEKTAWLSQFHDLYAHIGSLVSYVAPMRDDQEAILYPWTFFEDQVALVRPILQAMPDVRDPETTVRPIGALVIQLDREYLARQYFPDLVDRTFGVSGEHAFAITVRSAQPPFQPIYTLGAMSAGTAKPIATAKLFDSVQLVSRRRGYAPVEPSSDSRQWQLLVQEPAGSLEGLVAAWRNRNLLLSFSLLAILAACVAFILVLARRAEQLARLQMEFVAGVSHELCTPLAVISSAAENLADGVVENRQQLAEYGKLIHDQSSRLDRLVDQILIFAAGRYRHSKVDLGATSLAPVVAQVLDQSRLALEEAGFVTQVDVPADLPVVLADPATAAKALENLISNAVKYGVTNPQEGRGAGLQAQSNLAIRARAVAIPRAEVQLAVEDSGAGIAAGELAKIFEPFYRVQSVRNSPARGVGLGLYLVRQMMEGMGGSVSAASQPGRGATFILHFPVAPSPADVREDAATDRAEHPRLTDRPN